MPVMLSPSFVIKNVDSGVSSHEILVAAVALQRQLLEHFSPHWGIFGSIRVATISSPARTGEWRIELRKVPTIDDALGFHDEKSDGTPVMYVFPELCAREGVSWTSCASHEILETLADPLLRRCTQADNGKIWALEICDAVEGDSYLIESIEVSNFCFPEWGEPPKNLKGVHFDFLRLCTHPYEIRPHGYGQIYDQAKGWQQVGQMRAHRSAIKDMGFSRGVRRKA